ncbi:hypothetical protein HY045_02385 [Candidatus Woesebacteria bacterium]|nr:hypothetical protein [Candidatus Woesebacteria bacterium]
MKQNSPANPNQPVTSPFAVGDSSAHPANFPNSNQATTVQPSASTIPETPPTKGNFMDSPPPIDVNLPPVVTPPSSSGKKFGTGKIIATIFGLIVLLGGVGAGILLVRQNQNIREKASGCTIGATEKAGCACNTEQCIGVQWINECVDDGSRNGVWKNHSYHEEDSTCNGSCPANCGGGGECTVGAKRNAGCGCNSTQCIGVQYVDVCVDNGSGGGRWESKSYNVEDASCNSSCTGQCTAGNCITSTVSSTGQCTAGKTAEASITFSNSCNTSQTVSYSSGARNCSRPAGATGCSACGVNESAKTVTVPAKGEQSVSESCDPGECETCQVDLTGGGKNTGAASWQGGTCGVATPTPPGSQSAQCVNIVAYDTNWNILDTSKLALLKPGDKVRFAVSGTAAGVSIDKARFSINGASPIESAQVKPSTSQFYYEYTIPTVATPKTFTVGSQLHIKETDQWF